MRRRPPGFEPSGARTLALLSLALLALLGLVALASRGDRTFAGDHGGAREPSTAFWDYLFSVSLGVAVVGICISMWLMISGRARDERVERRRRNGLVLLFLVALVIGFTVGARSLRDVGAPAQQQPQAQQGKTPTAAELARRGGRADQVAVRPLGIVLPLLVGLAALAYFTARRRLRRRARGPLDDAAFVEELAALLDDTLDDLRAEPDPRRAVIAAYARTERALAAYGFPRRSFEAPLEYLDRIAAPLHERQPSARRLVFELTHLYERAKFSAHTIDSEMKDDAIETLALLRDELRAPEAAA